MLAAYLPVVIEVPLEKSVSPSKGQVIKRLMKVETSSPVTLESIQQKLNKAKELRELEYSKKIGQAAEDRLSRARERRSTNIVAKTTQVRNALDVKMEVAVQKRTQLINVIVQKAQKETEKLEKATQCRQDRENSLKSKHQIALEKINQSQIKKQAISKDTVQKAKLHTEKVLNVLHTKKVKEVEDAKTKEQGLE